MSKDAGLQCIVGYLAGQRPHGSRPDKGAGPKSAAEDETLECASVIHLLPGRLQLQVSDLFRVQPSHEELELRRSTFFLTLV